MPSVVAVLGSQSGGCPGHRPDAGIKPVSHAEVMEVFARNNERVKQGINEIIAALPAERTCACGSALSGAR